MDLIAAALLYLGKISGPDFLVSACMILLVLKGAMSLCPFPFYLPGFLMNLTDIATVLLLYFGATPMPAIKTAVIVVLLIKALPSLVQSIFLVIGWLSARRN